MVNQPPRVSLAVTASAGETSSTITRLNPDGTTVLVRTGDGNPVPISAGSASLFDYEMPYGQGVAYSSVESPATVSNTVTVAPARPWLVHPAIPSRSMQITFGPNPSPRRTRPVVRGVYNVLGRTNPIVISDGVRHGRMLTLTLLIRGQAEMDAFDALTADSAPLLLNVPTALGYHVPTAYISIGDLEYLPVQNKVYELWFNITMPYYEVDRPAGGSAAQRNLSTLTTFASITALNGAYTTLAAVQAGP
jgi:hypothetical protein